jgi:serine/threonine protein kinase
VALKVSLLPWDARFAREAELLSRLSHPSIPRLLDRGALRPPSGAEYPFVVMEWVQGTPLYAWAEQHATPYPQVCLLLAQLARALEALHAAGAVHRDVKGDNVLVRLADRRAVLIDFGSCHFQGAPRLTWQSLPPLTLAYLSPQAGLFHLRSPHPPDSYYPPSPADDLYALGVTAYRLVMGQYPPPLKVRLDEQGCWQVTSPDIRPLLESNPRVEPLLREVIVRLLADAPEARGTATQVAETLEAAGEGEERPERPTSPGRARAWKPWLALAAAGACAVLLWHVQPVALPPGPMSASTPRASDAQAPDAGTAAVGDTSPTEPQASTPLPTEKRPLAQEPLPEPRPGQARPDKKGQCPGRKQVPINGGCWVDVSSSMDAQDCAESGYVPFKGKCFVPAHAPPKEPRPTSSPQEPR